VIGRLNRQQTTSALARQAPDEDVRSLEASAWLGRDIAIQNARDKGQ
jgi:hypothetical protein